MRAHRAMRIVASRAGAVAAGGALLTLVAFVFDAAPLFVPALAFVVIGTCAPAWVWVTSRGVQVRRVLAADRVIEDEPLQARIEARRGPLGLPGAAVLDPFTAAVFDLSGPLSPLRGAREANVNVVARFARRGLHTLAPPSLIVSDPLDLSRIAVRSDASAQQLLVLPRTEPVTWLGDGRGRRQALSDGRSSSEHLAAVDFGGLRPYRPGTPASRIHWPALARGAGLIERRLQADTDSRPLVVLDARMPPSSPRPELLDDAVRAAASLTLELARRGGCTLLLPGEQRPTAVDGELLNWPAAHARLALVTGAGSARAPALGRSGGRSGPVIYVAAFPAPRLAALLDGAAGGATVLVAPDRGLVDGRPANVRRAGRAILEVSGCRGFLLGAGRPVQRPPRPSSAQPAGA